MKSISGNKIQMNLLIVIATLTVADQVISAPDEFQLQVLADEPVLYYQFNEPAGNIINHGSLGSDFDGVVNGTPTLAVQTIVGDKGILFDSSDDFVESLQRSPVNLSGNPEFSVETIIFVPIGGTANLWAPFLHWGDSDPDPTAKSVYFSFSSNTPNEIYVGFYNGGLQAPPAFAPLGEWHHLLWVREGGGSDQEGSTLYINGVDVSLLLTPDPGLCCNGSTPQVTSTEFRINRARNFDGQRFFTGTMDELALYDRALSAEEARAHFESFGNIFKDSFEN